MQGKGGFHIRAQAGNGRVLLRELFGDRERAVLAKLGLEWDCLDARDRCGTSRRR